MGKKTELTYEAAMEQLEAFLQKVENNQLSIDELDVALKKNLSLLKMCKERLCKIEECVNTILEEESGKRN